MDLGNRLGADMTMDLEKMQRELNAFLQEKYGKDVKVNIGADIVPLDELNEKQKEIESGKDKKETKQ